ncbi:Glyoxalase-like domain protein [Macrococcoides canis]|uniref:Glyoxalase-like domain protein n=1 Tax=Macrococcoides canis TaxID=1855823 RepID=A0A1W7AAI3_9STAP|nr:VOC family protein [Macrococcus canis]ARQ06110.1 Glyoxalase-like domain protein [Macrococcus canis]
MELGNFSVSLSVKDLHASIKFYETLGFRQVSGDVTQNWIVLSNGNARIGLFQGMFEGNMMTFNPKWDEQKNTTAGTDVREIAQALEDAGYTLLQSLQAEGEEGPAYFMVKDLDGNVLLFDQHV